MDLVGTGADEILSVVYDSSRRAELRAVALRNAVNPATSEFALYAEAAGITLGYVIYIGDADPQCLNSVIAFWILGAIVG